MCINDKGVPLTFQKEGYIGSDVWLVEKIPGLRTGSFD